MDNEEIKNEAKKVWQTKKGKERFLYFNTVKNNAGKTVFYILVNNERLAEIKFYDKKIKDQVENFNIDEVIKNADTISP